MLADILTCTFAEVRQAYEAERLEFEEADRRRQSYELALAMCMDEGEDFPADMTIGEIFESLKKRWPRAKNIADILAYRRRDAEKAAASK